MGCLNLPIEYYIGNRSKYDYVNDAIGRRTYMAKSGTAFTQSDTISYGYNDRSEVTSATAANDTTYNFGFAFDNIGNRSTYTTNETGSAVTSAYTSNNLNQYTAITNPTNNPTYDADGNMLTVSLSTGDWTMSWNGENRLTNITKSDQKLDFVYDYRGRRVEKKVTDKVGTIWTQSKYLKFVYETYKLIEVLDGANSDAVIRKFVWSGDIPISMTDSDGTFYYILDANKNVTQLIDSSGNVRAKYEYSPFGKITSMSGDKAEDNPIRFSSEYWDDETGLVYYNYRYYSPELGRWLSRDPIWEKGGINLYAMLDNDAINWMDYLGWGQFIVEEIPSSTVSDWFQRQKRGKTKQKLDSLRAGYEVRYKKDDGECDGGKIVLKQYIDKKVDSYATERVDSRGHRRVPAYTDQNADGESGLRGRSGEGSYIDAPSSKLKETFVHVVVTMKVEAYCRCPHKDDKFIASTQFTFDYKTRKVKPVGAGKRDGDTIRMIGNDEK